MVQDYHTTGNKQQVAGADLPSFERTKAGIIPNRTGNILLLLRMRYQPKGKKIFRAKPSTSTKPILPRL
jgi:hypothetical protein